MGDLLSSRAAQWANDAVDSVDWQDMHQRSQAAFDRVKNGGSLALASGLVPTPTQAPYQAGDFQRSGPQMGVSTLLDSIRNAFDVHKPWGVGDTLNAVLSAIPGGRRPSVLGAGGGRGAVGSTDPIPVGSTDPIPPQFRDIKLETPSGKTAVRLYRAETSLLPGEKPAEVAQWIRETPEYQKTLQATGRWFTNSRDTAQWYMDKMGGKGVSYVDVPAADANKYLAANHPEARAFTAAGRESEEFFLPHELAASRKPAP